MQKAVSKRYRGNLNFRVASMTWQDQPVWVRSPVGTGFLCFSRPSCGTEYITSIPTAKRFTPARFSKPHATLGEYWLLLPPFLTTVRM